MEGLPSGVAVPKAMAFGSQRFVVKILSNYLRSCSTGPGRLRILPIEAESLFVGGARRILRKVWTLV